MDRPMVATSSSTSLMSPAEWDIERPGISSWSLNTMPQDLVCPILMALSIDDIGNLAATNVMTYVSYITEPSAGTTPLACRGVVRAMRFARAKREDRAATLLALTHIASQDVRMRPGLLGQLAYAVPGTAAHQGGAVYEAWATTCQRVDTDWRCCFNTELPAALSYHLEMAGWQVHFSTNPLTQQGANKAALERLNALPFALWPELMQAFAARGMSVPKQVFTHFVDRYKACLFSISDLFATELATTLFSQKRRMDIRSTLCRLGVSDKQLHRLLMPKLASSVARSIFAGGEPLTSALSRWDVMDADFSVHVREAYLRRLFQYAKQHTAWSNCLREHGMPGVLSTERRHCFIAQIESDSIAVLGGKQQDIGAFVAMIESIDKPLASHGEWLAMYQRFKNVSPVAVQAALIHRWVRKLVRARLDVGEIVRVLQDIRTWRRAFEKTLGHNVHPRLVARAYAAEMEAWMILGEPVRAESEHRVRHLSNRVFATFPPSAWAYILERLSAASIGYVQRRDVLKRIQTFLFDARASSVYPSDAFAVAIAHALNCQVWLDLPDRAAIPLTKLDVFCARFDLCEKHRDAVVSAIYVDRLRTTTFRRQ